MVDFSGIDDDSAKPAILLG